MGCFLPDSNGMDLISVLARLGQAIVGAASLWIVNRASIADPKNFEVLAIWVLAFNAALEPGVRAVTRYYRIREEGTERDLRSYLESCLRLIVEDTNLEPLDIGVNAFFVSRRRLKFWEPFLRKASRIRIRTHSHSRIWWTKGKGVIGRCWESGKDEGFDLSKINVSSAVEWDRLADKDRLGLNFSEYERTRHYGAIVVVPIIDPRGKFRGCVSVDAPREMTEAYDQLWNRRVRGYLGDVAELAWKRSRPTALRR